MLDLSIIFKIYPKSGILGRHPRRNVHERKILKSEFQRNDQNLKPNKLELREDVATGGNVCENGGRKDVRMTRFSIKVAEIEEEVKY